MVPQTELHSEGSLREENKLMSKAFERKMDLDSNSSVVWECKDSIAK